METEKEDLIEEEEKEEQELVKEDVKLISAGGFAIILLIGLLAFLIIGKVDFKDTVGKIASKVVGSIEESEERTTDNINGIMQ